MGVGDPVLYCRVVLSVPRGGMDHAAMKDYAIIRSVGLGDSLHICMLMHKAVQKDRLSSRDLYVASLRFFGSKTFTEIGDLLGISASRTSQVFYKIVRKLRMMKSYEIQPQNLDYLPIGTRFWGLIQSLKSDQDIRDTAQVIKMGKENFMSTAVKYKNYGPKMLERFWEACVEAERLYK